MKWAGSKRNLIHELYPRRPVEFNDYYEPFSGSLAFALRLNQRLKTHNSQMFLGVILMPLVTPYEVIRDNLGPLTSSLQSSEYSWILKKTKIPDAYYCICHTYNKLFCNDILTHLQRIQLATKSLYLNKTNYNGLYHVNKGGKYNTSVDSATKGEKMIFDIEALQSMCTFQTNNMVTLFQGSYIIRMVQNAKPGNFIYFDPPYEGGFTQYDKPGFFWTHHRKLKLTVDVLHSRGFYVMVSN